MIPGRDGRDDTLKAAAIFGVVLLHTPGAAGEYVHAFRFCVPAFVTLWAMHFEQGLMRQPDGRRSAYARRRLGRLMVPYLFWTTMYMAVFHGQIEDWQNTPFHTIIGGWLLGYGWSGQYYFVILFQLTLLMPLLRRLVGPRSVWPILATGLTLYAVAAYLMWTNPAVAGIGDRLFIYWLPWAVLGAGLARGWRPRLPAAYYLIVAVAAFALAPLEVAWVTQHWLKPSPYVLPSVMVGTAAVVIGAMTGEVPPCGGVLAAVVAYVGRHTMSVFVINPMVVAAVPWRRLGTASGVAGVLLHLACTLGVVAVCLLAGAMFRRVGLGTLVGDRGRTVTA